LNDANAALEHHLQIIGMPLLPILSYRRASLGSESTVRILLARHRDRRKTAASASSSNGSLAT
jgi:hypothetical protein